MKRFLLCCTVCIVILALTGCGDVPQTQGEDSDALRIGVKNTEEHQVLGILAKILIEEKTDAKAKIVYDDDVTSETLFDDLQNKKLEMYFDYSGSVGENALSLNNDNDGDEEGSTMLLVELQNTLAGEYQTYLSNSIGYEGGVTIYITPEKREELNGISSYSDLAAISKDLVIGMPQGFKERVDGYSAMKEFYQFKFKKAKTYSEKEGFWALVHGEIDVMVGDTTSIYNSLYNLYLLSDDKRFFQPQLSCYVVRNEVFEEYDGVKDALTIMNDLLTAGKMSSIKRKIFWEGQDPETYLRTYLRARNLI